MAKKRPHRSKPPTEEEVVAGNKQIQRDLTKAEVVKLAVQLLGWPEGLVKTATKEELIELLVKAARRRGTKKAGAWTTWTLLQAKRNWKALQVNRSMRAWTALGREGKGP
jgi:hypothetical protein